jgi:ABC-type enterochelin transport system substrate-binding protein
MTMIARIVLGVVCATALAVASASAQQKNMRVRGTIEQVNGSVLTVKSRQGETMQVKVADDARVSALVKASPADIKQGAFVGSAAMPEADGHWKAVEVHIFPEALRGNGIGDRPHDLAPKSSMTNGTVSAMTSGTVGGTAANASGMTLTLNYKEGEKKIDVTPETVVVLYLPGSVDELKPGVKIFITAATRQADGTLLMTRANFGRDGLTPPM